MSRRSGRISGPFAARLIDMLESPAFRVLSLSAHRVINRIEIELAHHGGKDNGRLPVTCEDFEGYGINKHAIAAAIREATALGFVEITRAGRGGNAEFRNPNLFRLTYRASKGQPGDGTHEWRRIGSLEEAEMIAQKARLPIEIKTKVRPPKTPDFTPGKGGRKPNFSPPEKGGTGPPPEKGGTIYISGLGDGAVTDAGPTPIDIAALRKVRR